MPYELDPVIDQWYSHIYKDQSFYVIAADEDADTIEIQHYDGDIEELSYNEWRNLDIEQSEAPENWAGALDIAEAVDFDSDIADSIADDWSEPDEDYRQSDW